MNHPQEVQGVVLSTVAEYAGLVNKTVLTVYTDLSTGRVPLPPVYRFTPTSRPLFVNARVWLAQQIELSLAKTGETIPGVTKTATTPPALLSPTTKPFHSKKRGRPSNASRLALKHQSAAVMQNGGEK